MKIPDRFLRVAHRGASGPGLAPENTLAAFELAINIGTDAIECDVHGASDGAVVVMHDEKVNRTTNGKGALAEMSLEAIKRLDAGAWKDAKFAGEGVPTLRDMLTMINGRAISVIEIKAPKVAEAVVEDVISTEGVESAVIFSFNADAVREVNVLDPKIATAFLISGKGPADGTAVAGWVKQVRSLGAQAIAPSLDMVTPDFVQAFHGAGLKVWVWTVNEPEDMKRLREMGVDAIISDRIDVLNKTLGFGQD
jgi:glycerophosphoryl diester phosphodiesterase